jgi:hypothetical protein
MIDIKTICENCKHCEKGGFFNKLFGHWKCKNPKWTITDKKGKEYYPTCFTRCAINGFQDTCIYHREN